MGTVTLAAIDAAIFAALAALQHSGTPDTAHPFAYVGRFAGNVEGRSIREVCAQYPAALLRFDRAPATRTVNAVEGVEDRATAVWTVLTALEEPREIDDAIAATDPLVPGALALVDAVTGAVNGLVIDGAWFDRRVRVVELGSPDLIVRGRVYVHATRLEVLYVLSQVTPPDPSVPLVQIAGDVNLEGTADDAPNPIDSFLTF